MDVSLMYPCNLPLPPTHVQPAPIILEKRNQHDPSHPSFDLGLTPTPQPDQPLGATGRLPHMSILSYLTFDLGIRQPSNDANAVSSYQSTESSKLSQTQANQ